MFCIGIRTDFRPSNDIKCFLNYFTLKVHMNRNPTTLGNLRNLELCVQQKRLYKPFVFLTWGGHLLRLNVNIYIIHSELHMERFEFGTIHHGSKYYPDRKNNSQFLLPLAQIPPRKCHATALLLLYFPLKDNPPKRPLRFPFKQAPLPPMNIHTALTALSDHVISMTSWDFPDGYEAAQYVKKDTIWPKQMCSYWQTSENHRPKNPIFIWKFVRKLCSFFWHIHSCGWYENSGPKSHFEPWKRWI